MSRKVPSGSSSGAGGSDPPGQGLQEREEAVGVHAGGGEAAGSRHGVGDASGGPADAAAGGGPLLLLAAASVLDAESSASVRSEGGGGPAGGAQENGSHLRTVRGIGRRLGAAVTSLAGAVPIGKTKGSAGEERTATGDGHDGPDAPPEGAEVVRRRKAMAIGLAAVVLSSGISWAAASRIRSPAEIAARTGPPAASLITVPVEQRVLSSDVVVRG
ncbi:MAG: hypothetical protein ACRDJO_03760, partial [Actinomycetota bacterium]